MVGVRMIYFQDGVEKKKTNQQLRGNSLPETKSMEIVYLATKIQFCRWIRWWSFS